MGMGQDRVLEIGVPLCTRSPYWGTSHRLVSLGVGGEASVGNAWSTAVHFYAAIYFMSPKNKRAHAPEVGGAGRLELIRARKHFELHFISQRLIMLLTKQVTEDMGMKRKESVRIMIDMSKANE